jgi:hypothetical protein
MKKTSKWTSFKSFIKDFDNFGNFFALNMKGEESHKTFFGAIISIISLLFVLYYSAIKINIVANRLDPQVTFNTVVFPKENFDSLPAKENYFDLTYSIWHRDN